MSQAVLNEDLYVGGNIACKSIALPSGSVADASVAANAGIEATKVVHQLDVRYNQASGASVASEDRIVHGVFAAGTGVATVAGFQAAIDTAAAGAATVTVDLQKSTGAGAWASILSAPISISSSTAAKTVVTASVTSPGLNGGDLLRVHVVATAGGGTLPQGLLAEAFVRENPQ